MWEYIKGKMIDNPSAVIFDTNKKFSYRQFIDQVESHGKKLRAALPKHTKCAILCDHGLNTALAICACWFASLVAIPLSKNYGQKHYNSIIKKAEPSIIICDGKIDIHFKLIYDICSSSFTGNTDTVDVDSELT